MYILIPQGMHINTCWHLDLLETNFIYLGTCGGVYSGNNGTIISPNFPSDYPPNSYCVYTITVPQGRACVEFRNFNISYPDSVSVYNGTSHLGFLLRRFVSTVNNKYVRIDEYDYSSNFRKKDEASMFKFMINTCCIISLTAKHS